MFQITWQRSRYVYDMHYVYKAISKDVLEYCIRSVSEEALIPGIFASKCNTSFFAVSKGGCFARLHQSRVHKLGQTVLCDT